MAHPEPFFDTNVLVYLVADDARKARRSAELVKAGGIVSVQVLNEFVAVARRKRRLPWANIRRVLDGVRRRCPVVPLTAAMHERAVDLAERHQFNIYDAVIVAAALLEGCTTLYSEDMHDGQVVEGVRILNPFA
jgi:predicted nucleic acid-binding protein